MNYETINDRVVSALGKISLEEDVSILYACESGSRAWGFASEDSDYDVRYVYCHPEEWYMSIDSCKKRDVIDGAVADFNKEKLDFAGWDLRKALNLFRKGNPPFLEWLNSPITYVDRFGFARHMRRLAEDHMNKQSIVMHYIHMALGNWRRYLNPVAGKERVLVKKYLYVVRPLCAALYLIDAEYRLSYPIPLVPPVNFDDLLGYVELPPGVGGAIGVLLEAKRTGMELDLGPRIPELDVWISALEEKWGALSKGNVSLVPVEELNKAFKHTLEVSI